ncbi:RelA/SpoT family protein [Haloglycomyces albus]|uniref:RelA/SpoT family protein n=1 Tax=Haloglycomyces albus TaxID=526067 RepID=UPI00046D552D|nr:HD domain-containing protein [Haloglycomyces albus]
MFRVWRSRSKNDDPWKLAERMSRLLQVHRSRYHKADLLQVQRAYRIAEEMHRGQNRKSGEPYITHPIEVATILASLGVDTPTVAAGLLHDTVEDTSYSLEALATDFGDEIAVMVDGVTKLDKIHLGDSAEAETFRKLLISAHQDIRVAVIKLADRLHNMRTVQFKKRPSQIRIANATKDVLIPLADRLGLYLIKRELEDLVLQTLEPERYQRITEALADDSSRQRQMDRILPQVKKALKRFKVHAKLHDRPRHPYSVHREMEKKPGTSPSDPPRIVIEVDGDTTDCYAALGAVHQQWQPHMSKFRDLIAAKKFNLYQSLHTGVYADDGEIVEFLIRTKEMHRVAELGIIAELTGHANRRLRTQQQLPWLQRLNQWQSEVADSDFFLDSLRCDLAEQDINVLIPNEGTATVMKGANAIDLAYTRNGPEAHKLIAVYINSRIAPLTQPLKEGDTVDLVFTAEDDPYGPSEEWLRCTKTAEAKVYIRGWFQQRLNEDQSVAKIPRQHIQQEIVNGKERLLYSLRKKDRGLANEKPLLNIVSTFDLPDLNSLYVAMAREEIQPDVVAERLINSVDRTGML